MNKLYLWLYFCWNRPLKVCINDEHVRYLKICKHKMVNRTFLLAVISNRPVRGTEYQGPSELSSSDPNELHSINSNINLRFGQAAHEETCLKISVTLDILLIFALKTPVTWFTKEIQYLHLIELLLNLSLLFQIETDFLGDCSCAPLANLCNI